MIFHAPFFLVDGGDITAFASLSSLVGYVEPIDAVSGNFSVFDARGYRVILRSENVRLGRFSVGGGTSIAELSQPPVHEPDRLRSALLGFIREIGPERFGLDRDWLHACTLADLTSSVAASLGPL